MRVIPPLRRLLAQRDELRAAQRAMITALERSGRRICELETYNTGLVGELSRLVVAEDQLPPLRYLIMLTYGRSGSTLVQGIVNAIPGYVMRGENREALYHLFHYHHVLEIEREEHALNAATTLSAWYGINEYATPAALAGMRSLVVGTLLRPRADTRVIGFKEIRWWREDWRDYLDFLLELFPGVRFLINTRDHEAVARSKWWAERDDPRGMLERYEARLQAMDETLGDRAYRVRYEDYTSDPDSLRGLFDWLGEPFDRAAIDAVMSLQHSY